MALAGVAMAVAVRYNTFVAWGTDSSSYVEAAHRWADGRVAAPLPLQFWCTWASDWALTPLGIRPGVVRGTEVGTYPLGLSVLMAVGIRLGGELGAYLVPPVCMGLLVLCAYVLASWLAGSRAGLLAAGLVAASPATLVMAMQPMSDLPAASLWALAWVMSLRPGLGATAAAGAAVAAATMVRPNLTPLGVIVAWLVTCRIHDDPQGASRWRRFVTFAAVAAIGPLVLGWSQALLYGSPFITGYHSSVNIPRWVHVLPNLEMYPRLLVTLHTWVLLAGLLAPLLLVWSPAGPIRDRRAQAVLKSAPAFIVVTYLLYAPFPPIDNLLSLRFMLPGIVALFVLLSGLLVHVGRAIASRARILAPLAIVPACIVAARPVEELRYAIRWRQAVTSAATAGYYLREALPPNAAIIAGLHSGALAHYTNRLVLRFELIPANGLDAVVDDLTLHGYKPVLVLDSGEAAAFTPGHRASRFAGLGWPPRADFGGSVRLRYWDFADHAASANGHRWSTDMLGTFE